MPACHKRPAIRLTLLATILAAPCFAADGIAQNEAAAAAGCKAYCEAQEIYRLTNYNGDGVLQYAQCIHGHREPKPAPVPEGIPEPTAADLAALDPLLAKLSSDQFAERQAASDAIEKM